MVRFYSSHQKSLYFTRQGIYVWQVGRAELLYQAMVRFFNMGYYQKAYANRELYKQVRNNRYGHSSEERLPEVSQQPSGHSASVVQSRVDKPFSVAGQSNDILQGFTQREVVPSAVSLPVKPRDVLADGNKESHTAEDPFAVAEAKTAKPFDVNGVFTAILSQLNFGLDNQNNEIPNPMQKDAEIEQILNQMVKDKEYNKVKLKEEKQDEEATVDTPRSLGNVSLDSLFDLDGSKWGVERGREVRRENFRKEFNNSTFVVAPVMLDERGSDWRPSPAASTPPPGSQDRPSFRPEGSNSSFGEPQSRGQASVPPGSTSASQVSKQFVRHPSFSDPAADFVMVPIVVQYLPANNAAAWLQFSAEVSLWDAVVDSPGYRYALLDSKVVIGERCSSLSLKVDGQDMGKSDSNQTGDQLKHFVHLWQGPWGLARMIFERVHLADIEGWGNVGISPGDRVSFILSERWDAVKRAVLRQTDNADTVLELTLVPLSLIRVRAPVMLEARESTLLNIIGSLKSLEISAVCRSVLTRLGRLTFGPELLASGNQLSPEEAGCAILYSVCAGLPIASRERLYSMALTQAVQKLFPNERGSAIDFILSREGYLAYSDILEFFHEDTATLLISPWAKQNLPRRLETARATAQRVEAALLSTKILGLHLQSIDTVQPKAKTPVFDSLLLERCKVVIEAGLQPLQALSMVLWMESQLRCDPRPPKAREPGLAICQQTLVFLKCLMQAIDPDRFQLLTEDPSKGSLDSWLMPFLLGNFCQVQNTPSLLKFWDLQCVCCQFTQANSNIPLSPFQLIQVWLIVDSMDTPVFHDDLRNLAAAISYNLSLPIDQLLYSLANFLFDTLSKPDLVRVFDDMVGAQLALASKGPWRLSEVVSLLGVKFGLSGPGILFGLETWDSLELPPGEGQSGMLPRWKEKKIKGELSLGRGRSKPVQSYLPSSLKPVGGGEIFTPKNALMPKWRGSSMANDPLSMFSCEDILKNLLAEKAAHETPASIEETPQMKLAFLKTLELNGIHEIDEIQLENVKMRVSLEELVPELTPFKKDQQVLAKLLSAMAGTEVEDQIVDSLFNLFMDKGPNSKNESPRCSVISLILALISTLPDSNAYKQTLFLSLFNFLKSLFPRDSAPPHLLAGLVLTYCSMTINPIPLCFLVPCPIVSCMLGTSALISDDALGIIRKQWAYRLSTSFSNSVVLHSSMIGRFCAGVLEKTQPGFEVIAKVTYWDSSGNLKQSVREVSEPITGLVPPASPSTPSMKTVINLGEWRGHRYGQAESNWEQSERESEANVRQVLLNTCNFFDFNLTYAGLDRFSYTKLPTDRQIALRIALELSQPSLGSLIVVLTKDLDLFDSSNYLTKPPELNRQSTSQAGYSVYTALGPISLIMQPVFIILLYLRTCLKNLLSKEPTASQIPNNRTLLASMDRSFLMLSAVSGAAGNQEMQLDPEHTLLKVPEHLNTLLSTGVIDVVATLSN